MIEILSSGTANSVQDRGRFGYLDVGVSRSGAMDDLALAIGQALVGNPPEAAGIEIGVFPFRVRFHAAARIAVTGCPGGVQLGTRHLPANWCIDVAAGDALRLDPPLEGARACLSVRGGIDVPQVLGSRATDLKSGWGGHAGRGLLRGDRLAVGLHRPLAADLRLPAGFGIDPAALPARADADGVIALRVLDGAEYGDYPAEARTALVDGDWRVSAEANRQGYRLDGPTLMPMTRRDLFSHGIMPGTVQVPPSGQPIIQLAEANSCGGYPKIAHVIEADLWKLGQAGPGDRLRFERVDRAAAIDALRSRQALVNDIATVTALVARMEKETA